MGLRSPQSMPVIPIRQEGSTRFQGTVAPEINKSFLSTAAAGLNAQQEKEKKAREMQLDFIKTQVDNDAENDVIQANAELAQQDGLNSLDSSQKIREKLQRNFEKRKEKVPEQFHPYVDQILAKKLTRYNKFAIPHVLGQVDKVRDEADKTFIANSINEAIEDSGDLEEFNDESLAKVTYAIGKRAEKQYGKDPEIISHAITKGVSETVRRAVEQQAVGGRFDKADALINKFNDELLPADKIKVTNLMRTNRQKVETNEAIGIATAAAELEDPIEAEKYIRETVTTPSAYSAATAALRTINKSKSDSKKMYDGKAINSIFTDLSQGKALDPAKLNAIQDPQKRNKIIEDINKYGGIENRVTDKATYKSLLTKMFNDREGFKAENLEQYQINLSPDDYKFIVDKQIAYKEQENKRQDKIDYSTDKMIEDIAKDYMASALKSGTIEDDQMPEMYISMMDFQDRLVRQSKGMSERDIRRVFAERVQKFSLVTEPDSILFGLIPFGSVTKTNSYIPVKDHTEEEIDKVKAKTQWPTEKVLKFLDSQK